MLPSIKPSAWFFGPLPVLLMFLALTATLFAAEGPPEKRTLDTRIDASMHYALPYPDEDVTVPSSGATRMEPGQQLGTAAPGASPGMTVGNTFYDAQHNGRMGRMNETRTNTQTIAHFSWMYLPSATLADRAAAYTQYNFTSGTLYSPFVTLQATGDFAGYVNLDITNDNRGVVVCHNKEAVDGIYGTEIYADFAEAFVTFGYRDSVPRALSTVGFYPDGEYSIWPTMCFVEGPSDTVLHVFSQESRSNPGDPQSISYFRRTGAFGDANTVWDYTNSFAVDTTHNIAQTVEANDAGKTALVWIANVPCDGDPADGPSCSDVGGATQWNNDIYYMISNDYGVSWGPEINLTQNKVAQDADIPHFQPYTALSALLASDGNLHIVWNAAYWPDGETFYPNSRSAILHWSEDVPYIRTVVDATWEPGDCLPGVWNLTAAKASISECNGKFYVLYSQFNDRPNGVLDDCAVESNPGFPQGAANGDLYVTISADSGLTWDVARNLTNSRTPGCDSANGGGGPCDNDHWPTMARYGDNHEAGWAVPVILPAGGTGGAGWYLDVQYINDHSAGGIVQDEGTWQQADVKWFRLQCVDPIVAPNLTFSPSEIGWPAWTKAGVIFDSTVTITNIGNADYNYSVAAVEDAGTLSGWLSYTGFTGQVLSGMSNTATGDVVITPTGANPGEIHQLTGRLVFTTTDLPTPRVDYYEIEFVVADTMFGFDTDTATTGCITLLETNYGPLLGVGEEPPFANPVPEDMLKSTLPQTGGALTNYLAHNYPVVAWDDSWFQPPYIEWKSYMPRMPVRSNLDPERPYDMLAAGYTDLHDKLWISSFTFFPRNLDPPYCQFVIRRFEVETWGTEDKTGITLASETAWNLGDLAVQNPYYCRSDVSAFHDEIWSEGKDLNQNDYNGRYGITKFLGQYSRHGDDPPYQPLGNGSPRNAFGYNLSDLPHIRTNPSDELIEALYATMDTTNGFRPFSNNPNQIVNYMTFAHDYDLSGDEVVVIDIALVVAHSADERDILRPFVINWYDTNLNPDTSCCTLRGDFNNDGAVKVSDLTALITYLFRTGPPPECEEHGDCNADGAIKVSDLTLLIAYLFRGGPPPAPC